ncbi:MAG: shikimate dehydrogenase [Anaerolineae bacterium]|jgi:predicted amino acid dehydrogenase
MTNSFGFMIHPIEPQKDVARKFPILGKLPPRIIDYCSLFFPPIHLGHIAGIRSEATGEEIEGWLLACPVTPKRMLEIPVPTAYKKILQTGRLAERKGAQILGLGAFTSVVGDAGITISRKLSIPVTTGNSLTIAIAVEASLEAARRLGLDPSQCTAAIVGAYGSIGKACAQLIARTVSEVVLIGRRPARLQDVKQQVESIGTGAVVSTELTAIRQADIVLAATSAVRPIIEPKHLQPSAVVCDVARPRSVSRCIIEQRDDVLVIDGGVVDVPGQVDFGFDFGLPPGKAFACMAETMILTLEGRYECFTLGKEIALEQVDEIAELAAKHGFRLSGFRSFEHALSDDEIEAVQQRAYRRTT